MSPSATKDPVCEVADDQTRHWQHHIIHALNLGVSSPQFNVPCNDQFPFSLQKHKEETKKVDIYNQTNEHFPIVSTPPPALSPEEIP